MGMNTFSVDATREHVVIKTQIDDADLAMEVFKRLRANPENCLRTRKFDNHGRMLSEKLFGEDPDWEGIDREWDYGEEFVEEANKNWHIEKFDLVTMKKTYVGSAKDEDEALKWVAFEAAHSEGYGTKFVYIVTPFSI